MSNRDYEKGYVEGKRRAALDQLSHAMRELRGLGDEIPKEAPLLAERNEAIAVLRRICEKHGDNKWGENLHLADIIEKHLARHLGE